MSGAHVQTVDAQVGSGTSVNVSLTGVGAGHHLFAGTIAYNPGATSITTASSSPAATWSNAANLSQDQTGGALGTGHQSSRGDYTHNVASGSWTVTCNAATGSAITGSVTESSGIVTSASLGVSAGANSGATGVTGQAAGSVTPAAGSILIAIWGSAGANTAAPSADNSFVLRSTNAYNGANERGAQYTKDNVAASAVNVTGSESSGTAQQIMAVAEFLAAAAGASPLPQMRRRADPWHLARWWAAIR